MKTTIGNSFDYRQSPYWKAYMQSIGWSVETIDTIQIYIRKLPLFNASVIKIQHPLGKIPFKKIDALAKKYYAMSVIIEPHLQGYNEKEFVKNVYDISSMHHAPTATRKIDIAPSLKKITASFSENAKRNIKKAEKNNLEIKIIFGKDDKNNTYFETFYKLQKTLTDMKKFYAPGYNESKKKYMSLKNGSFFVFGYEKNDSGSTDHFHSRTSEDPIAVVWYGYYNGVITYLQTGINQRGYDLLANYLLVLEGIKAGKKIGSTVLDFESIYDARYPMESKRWKGYSEFKSRFHGEEIQYPPSWIKIYSPLFKWFYKVAKPFA